MYTRLLDLLLLLVIALPSYVAPWGAHAVAAQALNPIPLWLGRRSGADVGDAGASRWFGFWVLFISLS